MSIDENFYPLTPQQAKKLGKAKTLLHLRLTNEDWVECFKELTRAELGVLYYIRTKDPYGERNLEIDCSELGKLLGIHRTSISRALEELVRKGLLDSKYSKATNRDSVERRVRDHLKLQLGGLTEIVTPAGRIDLLAETEIIEVKHVSEWKSAMGQLLAYLGFYPEHSKRIHLWGRKGEMVSATAVTICLELNIAVIFGEVQL